MKKFLLILLSVFLISANANKRNLMVCTMRGAEQERTISFTTSGKNSKLAKINLLPASDTTLLHLENGNLILVAMDHKQASRLRVAISAHYLMGTAAYEGQMIIDSGDKTQQLDNGAVVCVRKNALF